MSSYGLFCKSQRNTPLSLAKSESSRQAGRWRRLPQAYHPAAEGTHFSLSVSSIRFTSLVLVANTFPKVIAESGPEGSVSDSCVKAKWHPKPSWKWVEEENVFSSCFWNSGWQNARHCISVRKDPLVIQQQAKNEVAMGTFCCVAGKCNN